MKTLSTLEQEARKRAGPRYSWPFGVALLVLGVSLLLFGLPATAQPQLTGRTVTFLVGYTARGGYDRFARIVARHLPRYLPGTPAVVVQNMPGAESVVAANHLFNAARPDGLTIGLFNRNLVFAQLVGVAGVRFDVRRWQWIGNLAEETDVFVIRADLPYRHILEKQWGLQIFTDVQGQPLDSPQFLPVFELAAKRDVPVWLHPTRSPRRADYLTESRSKYDIWWALGWPYETSICMARLVFSGVFDRWPELKILTHHMGGMVPYFEGRVGWGLDQLGTRTDEPEDLVARARLKRRPLEYFRRFYADTALYGSVAAVECGVAFFGAERVLFGTDFPFDPQHGLLCIRETVRAVENATLSEREREMIFYENAVRLLRLRSV